ncbi:MlaD family protein [Streptomyces sp. RB6PN25]|uniref:MlaD family protein n=1 Tax=Streptomyces humicola TaxID=2953240 RepID=A0ABT1PQJ6_9ACTN|nr:MlaD family protein [Streptomyces humicola]MCQ4079210.1 MlaD family protein [Streptomyces humicola]
MTKTVGRFGRIWQRVRTEPKLGRHVTVVVALIVLAAVAGGSILSNERFSWPWNKTFTFYATFPGSPGVSPGHGQEVRIAGVHVGEIEAVDVDKQGHARLTLSVDPKYPVYQNATLVLRPKSQLNEMYVEMNPGSPPAQRLAAGDTLPVTSAQSPVQLDQVLGHLDTNTREALTTLLQQSDVALADAANNLPQGLSAGDVVMQHLQPVVTALQTRRGTLQKLVTALSQISTAIGGDDQRLTDLINSLEGTLQAVGGHGDDLSSSLAQLPQVTAQLKDATSAVQTLSDQLNPTLDGLRSASGSLPGALRKLRGTVDQAGKVVDSGTPVVQQAVPVVQDLRPFVNNLDSALPALRSVTSLLNKDTAALVPSLDDLGPFLINTRSLTSFKDGNGGILRGFLVLAPSMVSSPNLHSLSTPTQPYRFPQ